MPQEDVLDPNQIIEQMSTVRAAIMDEGKEWRADPDAPETFRLNTSYPAPGAGMFGVISLVGKVSPCAEGYACHVAVNCLPMSTVHEDVAATVEEAKQRTREMMVTGTLAMLTLTGAM